MTQDRPIDVLGLKEPTYDELKNLVLALFQKVEELTLEVDRLKTELAIYKNPKNSGNSSVPPSQDPNRPKKNQSLRENSGRKSGGQNGHKGSTLTMAAVPDCTVRHIPDICPCCGEGLSGVAPVLSGKRQVVEIPRPEPVYIQHETYSRACKCGHVCTGVFPQGVGAPVQYGQTVQNIVAYLSVRQFLPFKRTKELMGQLFNTPMCEGSIANLLGKTADKVYPLYMQIKDQIQASAVVGADETGAVVNGEKAWIWTWQDRLNTFLAISGNRGKDTVNEVFPTGLPGSVLVSDAWAPHLSTGCKGHQLCIAHLLRDLNYFIELCPLNPWPQKLKSLFISALALKRDMAGQDYGNSPKRDQIEKAFALLLKTPPAPKGKMLAFYKRMLKNKDAVFRFLYDDQVPPDNNASERSIRNVKVKQKVSGQFKTFGGAEIFAVIRSVIDTYIKRGLNIFDSLSNLPNLAPE